MFECPNCKNDETLIQSKAGFERLISVELVAGALRSKKGQWLASRMKRDDGFYCASCYQPISLPEKIIRGWQLYDSPITTTQAIDLDSILEALKRNAHEATMSVEIRPGQQGNYGSLDDIEAPIPEILKNRLTVGLGLDLNKFYSHQIEALGHAFQGKNVVLQTPTASGKSLCYLLPVFTRLLQDPNSTALFVYPMKALAFDQRKKIAGLAEDFDERKLLGSRFAWPLRFGEQEIWMGSYERETRGSDQTQVKEKARIVLTNPDSLHMKILPHFETKTGSWERFLTNLQFVVVDEIHSYRGLFGAHVAYVIRRLRMMCDTLGSSPQFFCASATLPSPKQHAQDLVGLPFELIEKSGSPQHNRAFVLWNPGMSDKKTGERREPTSDAIEILRKVLLTPPKPVQTMTFIRSLARVERFNLTLRNNLSSAKNPFSDKTRTYKSTLTLQARNEVSDGLLSGQIVHVTCTNALELGIDIGDMNCCLMIGYPGTVSSTLQQSGRVGRKGNSIAILLLRDEPLEQWFARDPDDFFRNLSQCEPIRLPIQNPYVMEQQLKCAAWDLNKPPFGGLTPGLVKKYFGTEARSTIEELERRKALEALKIRGGIGTFWVVRQKFGDVYQNIRVPISIGKFRVIDEDGSLVGECDSTIVPRDLFPGAIWINEGEIYESKRIIRDEMRVEVRRIEDRVDHFTFAMPQTTLDCREKDAETRRFNGYILGRGVVSVRRQVRLYRRVPVTADSRDAGEVKVTNTDPIEYTSTAFWLDIPQEVLESCGIALEDAHPMIHTLEHAVRTVFPLVADIDPGDLGSSFDINDHEDKSYRCRLYVFDNYAGGTGLSEFAYEKPGILFAAAYKLLDSCNCAIREGCPRCTIIPWCEYQNQELDKNSAKTILTQLKEM